MKRNTYRMGCQLVCVVWQQHRNEILFLELEESHLDIWVVNPTNLNLAFSHQIQKFRISTEIILFIKYVYIEKEIRYIKKKLRI